MVVSFVLAVGAGGLLTANATPMYSSSARLFVSTTESDSTQAYQGGLFASQRVRSYADLVKSRELAEIVANRLAFEGDPTRLSEKVSARVVPDTVILQVTVLDPAPEDARRIAQTYAEELQELVRELETPVGESTAPIRASVVDKASFSDAPVSPVPIRNLGLAAVLGLLLGFGLSVVRELLDTTLKSDVEASSIAKSPVLGNIAFDSATSKRPLVSVLDPHAPRAEAFRILRTNMQFVDVDSESKVYVVSSSLPGEGKTTTAVNLALTLAQAGERVLLIEADLRRPKIGALLDVDDAVGLTSVLVGKVGIDEAIQSTTGGLDVMPSGAIPPNPAELLQSNAMSDTLSDLRKRYDLVLLDAPPLLPVTDAALLASHSDGALLIVRHGKTSRDQLAHAVERLEAVGARAIGVVVNMAPTRGRRTGYGYGYGYGYGPEAPKGKGKSKGKSKDDLKEKARKPRQLKSTSKHSA